MQLLTQRAATERLRSLGIGPRQARQVLDAGLAGDPLRTSAALLFESERVESLVRRPVLPWAEVDEVCPSGLFVARRSADDLRDGWTLPLHARIAVVLVAQADGQLPMVATTGGFVTGGAGIVDTHGEGTARGRRDTCRLDLVEPASWFESFHERRLPTGPGRPWWLHGAAFA
jgi:hypothetical protein